MENKIDNLVNNAIKNLSDLVDVNSVIGDPIATTTGTVIPISKVTVGYLSGGGEYGEVKYFKKDENYPFSGGNGAVVSLKPMGFLIDNGKECRLITIANYGFEKLLSICEDAIHSISSKSNSLSIRSIGCL